MGNCLKLFKKSEDEEEKLLRDKLKKSKDLRDHYFNKYNFKTNNQTLTKNSYT